MRTVVLYIAISLDGYIADRSGGIPLFREREGQRKLKLVSSGSYNGFTDLIFERRA